MTISRVQYHLPDGFDFWDEGDCLRTGETTLWRMDPSDRRVRLPGAGPARLPWDTGAYAIAGISLLLALYYLSALNARRPWYESLRFDTPAV